ncbi:VOC family protein [Arthrobacter gandavensis]|uniref:VOC family protein n=1 Tax=Arthrobacter gandavensis TaxID=169960 RepID=UPI0018903AFC|nr:VOC family protein [Arthrobacter gandavensis]MBF4992697.1 VOC family protein [Arthrobacter gandavensis]
MSISTTTHLNFRGTAGQALEFYRTVFGGALTAATYGDAGMPQGAPGADKIVFGQLETAEGFRLMAYDIPGQDSADISGTAGTTRRENGTTVTDRTFFQSLRGQSLAEVQTLWDALADGGDVIEPFTASAWSPGFGMLTDRFGVTWVIDVEAAPNG